MFLEYTTRSDGISVRYKIDFRIFQKRIFSKRVRRFNFPSPGLIPFKIRYFDIASRRYVNVSVRHFEQSNNRRRDITRGRCYRFVVVFFFIFFFFIVFTIMHMRVSDETAFKLVVLTRTLSRCPMRNGPGLFLPINNKKCPNLKPRFYIAVVQFVISRSVIVKYILSPPSTPHGHFFLQTYIPYNYFEN